MTDRELLTDYLDGDSAAFAELVRRHGDWIWGCALRQAPDSATAEDITQAAFLLLSRKAAALRRHESLHGWLFRVVQLLARDARKLAARRQYHEMKVAAMKQEQTQGNADWDALQSAIDSAVAKLRDADREAILLRFYEGLPLAEVARTMKLSEDAATKRVSRAVARLKAALSGEGISTPADVQNLLSTGLSCSAPAALIAQIAASHTTPAAAALATKGAHLLASAKLKAAAALVAGTIVVASATTGVILATRPAAQPTASAATMPAAPAAAAAPDVQAPPIRPGKQATAVNRTIFALRQADTDKLVAVSQLVSTDQAMQAYVGNADALRPVISTVLASSVSSTSLDWQSKYSAGFGIGSDSTQLAFGPANDRELIYLEGNTVISAGKATQIAGSVSVTGWANIPSLAFAPFAIGPSEISLQIIPVTLPRAGAVNLVFAYEAVPVDVADRDPLSQMTDAAAWFAGPRNKTLRIARAGAVWQSMVPENKSSVARLKALKLPSGASVSVRCISDKSVDPLAAWTADGQPAEVMRADKPRLHLRIDDPNLPPFIFSNTNVYEGWAVVPLIHRSAEGYACTIGYGDGKYSTVASLPAKQGATASFAGCTLTIERIGDRGGGECRSTGTLPKDTDFDLVAVLKDGSWRWNTQRSGHVEEGKQPALPRSFSFDTNLTQITHLEIRSRPLKWVTFQRLAAKPVVALPTGMEPPVDRDESKRQILASATPADRKAFLDKVNCVRYWGSDRSDVKRDAWMWRDARYRIETWTKDGHTLVLGDKKNAWSYDPQTGNWTEKREPPGREMGSFAEMMASIGGMESVIALGETVGTEPVHGTPCTIRTGRLESRTVKVWLDSLGIIHRLDCDPPGGESAIIDYDPAGAEQVWTPPVAFASAEPVTRYQSAAEAFLAKAVPADKPIKSITAAGRTFELLSIKSIRDDMAVICTSTELLPESRKHRDDTGERWQATQMYGIASWSHTWVPRVIARLHMPYREVTWWSLLKGNDCKEPDLADVLVVFGEASGSFPMEGWIESQPNPTRMHQLAVDLLQADHVDLDAYLREVYQLFESYRKAVGEAGSNDFITASDTWEKFKQTAESAIAGREAVSSSGR